MNQNGITQLKAYFLIILILMIPIYSASAMAASVTITQIQGTDQIKDFRRKTDTISVTARILTTRNTTISAEQVQFRPPILDSGQGYNFQSCSNTGRAQGLYECSYTHTEDSVTSNAHNYAVDIYDNQSNIIASTTRMVYVDSMAPKLESLDIFPRLSKGGNITISYKVTDKAYASATKCSGIQLITFTMDGIVINTLTPPENMKGCSMLGTFKQDISTPGIHAICVKAIDRFNLESQETCKNTEVDKSGPIILGQTLTITKHPTENKFEWVRDTEYDADVKIKINNSNNDLDLSSVIADLTELNTNMIGYDTLGGICETDEEDQSAICTWKVLLKLDRTITPTLKFSAKDILGNQNTITARAYEIKYDSTSPRIQRLYTTITDGTSYFLSKNKADIILDITEAGIGINETKVYLDLTEIELGNHVQADECIQGWKCYWHNITTTVESGPKQLTITRDSQDNLGNILNGTRSWPITVDNTEPQVNGINIIRIPSDENYGNYTIAGDTLIIQANITEETTTIAILDINDFIAGQTLTTQCNPSQNQTEPNLKICNFELGPISQPGPYTGKLLFNFTDLTGNILNSEREWKVYGVEDTETDYWQITSVDCTPDKVDRELMTIINQKIYCEINLAPKTQTPKTFSMQLDQCQNGGTGKQNASSLDFLSQQSFSNNQEGSTHPFIQLTLGTSNPTIDKLVFICPIKIRSIVNNEKITKTAEIENATITIPLYNNPLGEPSKEVQKQIDDVIDTYATGWVSWIGKLDKFLNYCKKICGFIDQILRLWGIIKGVGMAFGFFGDAAEATGAGTPIAQVYYSLSQGMGYSSANADTFIQYEWMSYVGKFCSFVSCRLAWGSEGMQQWQQAVLDAANWWNQGFGLVQIPGYTNYNKNRNPNGGATQYNDWFKQDGENMMKGFKFGLDNHNTVKFQGDVKTKTEKDHRTGKDIKVPETKNNKQILKPGLFDSASGPLTSKLDTGHLNVQDSYLLSALTFCIPGIIYNLEKYRQIKCSYADCLYNSWKQGLPVYFCKDLESYQTCKYFWGPIFQLIPFGYWLDFFSTMLKNAITEPFLLIDWAVGAYCQKFMEKIGKPGFGIEGALGYTCVIHEVIKLGMQIWEDLKSIKDNFKGFKIGGNYCDRIKKYSSEEQKKAATKSATASAS